MLRSIPLILNIMGTSIRVGAFLEQPSRSPDKTIFATVSAQCLQVKLDPEWAVVCGRLDLGLSAHRCQDIVPVLL